jgi:hypothetical protein
MKNILMKVMFMSVLLNVGSHQPVSGTIPMQQTWDIPGTDLAPVGISVKVSDPNQLYPFLQNFYQTSPQFKDYWERSTQTPRSGQQCDWNNISDNSCLMAQAFFYLLNDDHAFYTQRCPNVLPQTYQRLTGFAREIASDEKSRRLFYLMIYARDFGWVDTKKGQGHQKAGEPVIAKILEELKLSNEIVELLKTWMANHSVPAETFNGEVSHDTLKTLLEKFGEEREFKMIPMFVMLNYLELNCIKINASGGHEEITSFLCDMADSLKHETLYKEILNNRLFRIMFAPVNKAEKVSMRNSQTSQDVHEKVIEETKKRVVEIQEIIETYSSEEKVKIKRFIESIDLHYVVATFPLMSPKSLARFLRISANYCFPDLSGKALFKHVITSETRFPEFWEELLESSETMDQEIMEKYISISSEGYVQWNPPSHKIEM